MTDETAVEPYEWYKAIRHGEVLDEGPTPIPEEIREQATEIQWSNPTTDKQFSIDEPESDESFAYTPPQKQSKTPNAPRIPGGEFTAD